ncbi:hypothetical protein [Nocardiopsis sp. CC223A]|uniref:hypothetical protein n=1 Tax=Nocardiopsis sp. CC223A TaxID=3044051 RepID=UPI00278C68C7|nr:hypothetical protein [Nocardiopsis sp. CC223A]
MDEWAIIVVEARGKLPFCPLCEKIKKETNLFWGVHPTCLLDIYYGRIVIARIGFNSNGEVLCLISYIFKEELEVSLDHFLLGGQFGKTPNRIDDLFRVG